MGCSHTGEDEVIHSKEAMGVRLTNFVTPLGQKLIDSYDISADHIGKGGYGEVRRAVHKKLKVHRAIKIIKRNKKNPGQQKKIMNEINILKQLDHPNIIKIFEFASNDKYYFIVTELCTGGELFDRILQE
jgi:calcium-dependent protein kinase